MPAKTSIYSVDIYMALLKGMDNEKLAQQILANHESGNLSLIKEEGTRANNEEDSTLPDTEETKVLTELIIGRVIDVIEEHLSCVYYVKTHPNCGKIWFNPMGHNRKMFSVEPEDGMLVIFPSWLPHFTERNLSKQVRICISANFSIKETE